MKNKILLFAIVLFAISCNSGTDKTHKDVMDDGIMDISDSLTTEQSELGASNKPSLWTVEFENNTNTEKLKEPTDDQVKSLSAADMITILNDNFKDVQLEMEKISNDTIFVNIPESTKLTQQMGSTGAYNYMAAAVFNLTELDHIKFVKFNFKQGDHSSPGVYSREDFKQLR
ncbi:MAG: hypothetical protein ABIN48_05580 [Ginsengibacter sp.]